MWCKLYVSDDEIIKASEISDTMSQAATLVKLKFSTFKRRAESLNVYKINPGRKGLKKTCRRKRKVDENKNRRYFKWIASFYVRYRCKK